MKLSGLFTAVVTPFSEGRLNEPGFVRNLDAQIQAGVDGVVVLGTTGEAPTLTDQEKKRLVALAVEHAGKNLHIMVGTGGNSTAATIAATQQAKEMGADSALVVAPYYNRPTQKGLYDHYTAVAKAVDLPLIAYNIPSRSGIGIETMTLLEIAHLPNLIGIKEASGDIAQMGDILHHVSTQHPEFSVLSGEDALTFPAMAMGADGVISTLSNVTPSLMVELVHALNSGDFIGARQLHFHLLPLFKAMGLETNPIPVKAAMDLCGKAAGPARLPLTPLSEAHHASLHALLQQANLLPAGRIA